MSFWKIAWRNMRQRALASSLTGLSMALGVAVMICVIVIHSVAVRQFQQDAQGYHLIVGNGKGSPMELVLSTVFHVGTPLYPIPYDYYREFTDGKFAPFVEVAVPYCMGDSFVVGDKVFRVIGTSPDLFDKIKFDADEQGNLLGYKFSAGRNFKVENCYEAVLGSVVAAQSGLVVGDYFNPTHGISDGENPGKEHGAFEIVGVLKPTGTANDRGVFVNMEGFYLGDGHALTPKDDAELKRPIGPRGEPKVDEPRGTLAPPLCYDTGGAEVTPLPERQREVTSILVLCRQFGQLQIDQGVNKDPTSPAQAITPTRVVTQLLQNIVGPVQVVLLVLTILIVLVASISILVSIYNSMSERSHDIAVMRALGASRQAVMLIILVESILLSVLGGLAGIVLGHGLVGLAAPYVVESTGVRLNVLEFDEWEAVILPALVALASLVGLLPALNAYRTDVARSLSGVR
ncbi:MAG: ABC transporter permease [Planctomycetota bacterium]